MPAQTPTFAYLRRASDDSRDANVDGSGTPVEFLWTAAATTNIARLIVLIQDNGTFDADLYGNGVGLTAGILLCHRVGGVDFDLLDGEPIRTNADWGGRCYDVSYFDVGNGDNFLLVRWTFERAGCPVRVGVGDALVVTIQDDLSSLSAHQFQMQGEPAW